MEPHFPCQDIPVLYLVGRPVPQEHMIHGSNPTSPVKTYLCCTQWVGLCLKIQGSGIKDHFPLSIHTSVVHCGQASASRAHDPWIEPHFPCRVIPVLYLVGRPVPQDPRMEPHFPCQGIPVLYLVGRPLPQEHMIHGSNPTSPVESYQCCQASASRSMDRIPLPLSSHISVVRPLPQDPGIKDHFPCRVISVLYLVGRTLPQEHKIKGSNHDFPCQVIPVT